jgi:Flp pilus assembly pilin Flp
MTAQRMLDAVLRVAERSREQEGQALVEYALLLSLIAIVAIGVVQVLGVNLSTLYQSIVDAFPSGY